MHCFFKGGVQGNVIPAEMSAGKVELTLNTLGVISI